MVALVALGMAAVVLLIANFFAITRWLWEYWYITIAVGTIIWIALLGLEFGPRQSVDDIQTRVENFTRRWLSVKVRRRPHPVLAWVRARRRRGA